MKRWQLGLFVAAWEVFRGIQLLARHQLAEEAMMLSRTLFEDSLRLRWLSLDLEELEKRAVSYRWSSLKYERDMAKAARDNRWEWAEAMSIEQGQEMAAIRRLSRSLGLGDEPPDFPRTQNLLAEMNEDRLFYWWVRASQSIHSTAIGTSARVEVSDSPSVPNKLPLKGTLVESARVGILAAELFLSALVAASTILRWGEIEKPMAFANEFSLRAQSLFQRIGEGS